MFPFNLLLEKVSKKSKSKKFEPLTDSKCEDYMPPSPGEIKKMLKTMTRCSHCHFLIFDNYFSGEIEKVGSKLCPTCGCKL